MVAMDNQRGNHFHATAEAKGKFFDALDRPPGVSFPRNLTRYFSSGIPAHIGWQSFLTTLGSTVYSSGCSLVFHQT